MGLCVIISNYKFQKKEEDKAGLSESSQPDTTANLPTATGSMEPADHCPKYNRDGTHLDVQELEKTFEWLNFKVEKHLDCTAQNILDILASIARRVDLKKYFALVCCILSHGGTDGIYGTDWQIVTRAETRKIFDGNRCKALLEKPKVFFIQACRGLGMDYGVLKFIPDEPSCKSTSTEPTERFDDDLPGPLTLNTVVSSGWYSILHCNCIFKHLGTSRTSHILMLGRGPEDTLIGTKNFMAPQ